MNRGRALRAVDHAAAPILRLGVLALALLLLVVGASKALDAESFSGIIESHGLVPASLAATTAWGGALFELCIGAVAAWCIISGMRRWAALGAALVGAAFFVFAAYAALLVVFPPPEPAQCGCAGVGAEPVEQWMPIVTRNATIASLASIAAVYFTRGDARPRPTRGSGARRSTSSLPRRPTSASV